MLLGLSGGADSMALFHSLHAIHYPFEAAYLDHGWREESQKEALYLAEYCRERSILFHTERCSFPQKNRQNLEERGREARLSFFKKIVKKRRLEGVFLAHHADDQAETVLKRIFEGAGFPHMRGLTPLKEMQGIRIYRPFLKIKKANLLKWLNEQEILYFNDETNQDPRFLRTRLRNQLIPSLSHDFGKEISTNLCRIGESALELAHFLDELIAPFLERIEETGEGVRIDFSQSPPSHPYLWRVTIQKVFKMKGLVLSHFSVDVILEHLRKGSCHKTMRIENVEVLIDRKQILIKLKD